MIMWLILIIIGTTWLAFASVEDLKTKEVANWITFSLLAIGLAARAFFSASSGDWSILLRGLVSTAVMFATSYAFYYSRVFAGGDAKLLRGLGAFIPGSSYASVVTNSFAAIMALMLLGFAWSLAFSIKVSIERRKDFKSNFKRMIKLYIFIVPLAAIFAALSLNFNQSSNYLVALLCFSMLSYPYLKAVDKTLIRTYKPSELTEGDWLLEDVKIGRKTIKSNVHGLSMKDIALIRKYNKKVIVKEGIPFVPAFLLAFVAMVFFFSSEGQDFLIEILQMVF